jgi:hypothetical protein
MNKYDTTNLKIQSIIIRATHASLHVNLGESSYGYLEVSKRSLSPKSHANSRSARMGEKMWLGMTCDCRNLKTIVVDSVGQGSIVSRLSSEHG